MLEAEAVATAAGSNLPPCYDEGDDEQSVLPRDTRVVVTGNNRTKSVLVGLRGVVKKAVGLGGWHWLVLTNGVEVKLQRNALSVVEGGPEEDQQLEEADIGNPFGSSCTGLEEDDFPRAFKPRVRPRKPTTSTTMISKPPAAAADNTSQAVEPSSLKRSTDKKGDRSSHPHPMLVDLSKLETAALRKYRRHFKLADVGPNSSKEQLLHAVGRHFMSQQQLDELQVLTGFMQAAKRLKT